MLRTGLAWVILLLVQPCSAQDAERCAALNDAKVRAACLQAVNAGALAEPASSRLMSAAAAVSPVSATIFRPVSGRELAASPARFVGKPLAIQGAQCVYADVNDYKCSVAGQYPGELEAQVVKPPPAQNRVEMACGTRSGAARQPCGGTVLVVPTSVLSVDGDTGPKVLLRASSITLRPTLGDSDRKRRVRRPWPKGRSLRGEPTFPQR